MIISAKIPQLLRCPRLFGTLNFKLRNFHQTKSLPVKYRFFRPVASPETLRIRDKLAEGYEIIYRVPIQKYILAISYCSTLTSLAVAATSVYILLKGYTLDELSLMNQWGTRTVLSTNKYELVAFTISFVIFNITVFLMVRRLPLRIYRKVDEYIALYDGHFPFVKRKITFKKGQVEPLKPTGIMPWKDSRFSVNGHRSIMLYQYFRTPYELHRMINEKYMYE